MELAAADGSQNDRNGVVNRATCYQKVVINAQTSVAVAGIEAQSRILIIHTSNFTVNITS